MIHPNDRIEIKTAMQLITNISRNTASRYIHLARQHYGKHKHQILQVSEFCHFYGLDLNSCNMHQIAPISPIRPTYSQSVD